MSQFEEIDEVSNIVAESEKVLCKEIAKIRNLLQKAQEETQKRVFELETENRTFRQEMDRLKEEMKDLKENNCNLCQCKTTVQTAFTAALKSVTEQNMAQETFHATRIELPTRTQKSMPIHNPGVTGSETGSRMLAPDPPVSETSPIYTDVGELPDELLIKLGPYISPHCPNSTRERLNQIQKAFLKYKVFQLRTSGERIGDSYIRQLIQEGVDEHLWTPHFKPSREKSLEEYLVARIKNERKLLARQEGLITTRERVSKYLEEEMQCIESGSTVTDMD